MRDSFDYTMMSCFQTCQRKYWLRFERNLVGKQEAMAPAFGKGIHKGLDEWYRSRDVAKAVEEFKKEFQEDLERDDKRTWALGKWILENYDVKYRDQPHELIATEQTFNLALPNGKRLIGRMDKIVKWHDAIWVVDHKTSSGLGPTYIKMAEPNLQFDGYVWAARQMGHQAVGVLVDALLVAKGLLDSSQRARLTPLLRYDSYRSDERLKEFLEIVEGIQGDIADCEETGKWLPNFGACTQFGECAYRRVCLEEKDFREIVLRAEYKEEVWDPTALD